MAIPNSMRAVQLRAYDGKPESITVVEMPVPRPGVGEVLVRVFASPINPSDLMFIRGLYGFKKPLPAIPGFEGSGSLAPTDDNAVHGHDLTRLGSSVPCLAGHG